MGRNVMSAIATRGPIVIALVVALPACSALTGFSDLRFDRDDGAIPPRDAGPRDADSIDGEPPPPPPPIDGGGTEDGGGPDASTDCDEGQLDCDGDGTCEVDRTSDRASCGGCMNACAPGDGCFDGECAAVVDVALARNGHHACAVLDTGRVVCWGSNQFGQLGDGTFTDRSAPTHVVDLPSGATAVAAGPTSTCAITAGTVHCWGLGLSGEVGGPPGTLRATPSDGIGTFSDAVAIAAGNGHYCALRMSGIVLCWGANDQGQIGDGTLTSNATPVVATGITGAVEIVAGLTHTCALLSGGQVSCWGQNDVAQTGVAGGAPMTRTPTTVSGADNGLHLSAGGAHTCLVRTDGKVRCWGYGGLDQLGRGERIVAGEAAEVVEVRDATLIASGRDFSCAASSGGDEVRCWGQSAVGQLGIPGRATSSGVPLIVPGVASVRRLFAGDRSACALTSSDALVCWGADEVGQLGRGRVLSQPVPAVVSGVSDVRAMSVGVDHVCTLSTTGAVSCWGSSTGLQLGNGTDIARSVPTPTGTTPGDYVDLACGGAHTCARRIDGGVDCWGSNGLLQLGVSMPSSVPAPAVSPSLGAPIDHLAAGHAHTCARYGTGSITCWGFNSSGQLGRSSISADRGGDLPGVIPGEVLDGNISASDTVTCYVASAHVRCAGDNAHGELGDGTLVPRASPADVVGIEDAMAVAVGQGFACAIHSSGGVSCWGRNDQGMLGNGTIGGPRTTPVEVVGITDAIGIAAGLGHACARLRSGPVVCWGGNRHGQLGDGTRIDRAAPVVVEGIEDAAALGAGLDVTCALRDGRVSCWGARAWGKLGDGMPLFSADPASIAGSP